MENRHFHTCPWKVLLTLLLAFLFIVWTGGVTQAQTPTTTVKDASGNTVFQTFANGQLLAPGPLNAGNSIPASGGGVRLMWWPEKAALRFGAVGVNKDGTQWDASKIGNFSTAFGVDTKASDKGTVAMGSGTTAGNGGNEGGQYATAMGHNTIASGTYATAMGHATTASSGSDIATGKGTTASGGESFAAGWLAAAEDFQSFVWNDGSTYHPIPNVSADGLSSGTAVNGEPVTGSQTFSVSAQGGVRFITGGSSVTYIDAASTGWSTASTREAKTNIDRVDPTAVLAAVEAMPISTWEYKSDDGEGQGTRHIGPMAEDFHGELPYDLGSSTDQINSVNADGVTLGAVKGLAEKVERQQSTIEQQRAQIATLKKQVKRIESMKERIAALEAKVSADDPALASLEGPWGLVLLLGLGLSGLGAGFLYRRE